MGVVKPRGMAYVYSYKLYVSAALPFNTQVARLYRHLVRVLCLCINCNYRSAPCFKLISQFEQSLSAQIPTLA